MEQRIDQPVPIPGTKLILGLFFTILGVLWTGENLRLLHGDDFLRYWPVVVVLIGVRKLLDPTSRVVGAILTIAGASILGYTAGWVRFTIFDFWPLLLIAFGAVIVARALGVRLPVSTSSDSDQIWSVFNVREIKNTSRDYNGGGILAFMGGCQLDLTQADIVHSPAIIDLFAMWGGIEIYVPDGWEVIGEVVPFMAGFEMRTGPESDPQKQLIVRGAAFMGGIEIKRRTS